MNPSDILQAIERLRQAASGDKPKPGNFVIGAIVGAVAGGVQAAQNHPWPGATWQDAEEFDDEAWGGFADQAEDAVTHASWPA